MSSIFSVTSPAFADGDSIPEIYSCKGRNMNPQLDIHHVPDGAASLALIMHDPDAPGADFLHWSVWNLNPSLISIPEGRLPDDALQGQNSFGRVQYGGPCPPSGTHRYIFDVYALDSELDLSEGASRGDVMEAIEDHVLAKTSLTGTLSAQ